MGKMFFGPIIVIYLTMYGNAFLQFRTKRDTVVTGDEAFS